jgi:L-alanine-DL-glutamate epimerase-like enolase superfamily enzyme
MKMLLHQFDLPLRHTFTISRGSISVSRTLVVELRHDQFRGYGEAGESTFYQTTRDDVYRLLESVQPEVESAGLVDPAVLWERLAPQLSTKPFAQCALDMAAWDLWGKVQGMPLWRLWGLTLDHLPVSNYTIGIDSIDAMVMKMEEFPGWPVYKIKLGTPDDLEIVRQLRRHTDARFRVDANCAWTADQAIGNSEVLKELGVEFIEQPLPPDDWSGMRRVYARSALPVIADESCRREVDVDRCRECFHGINVKLVKCGGLTPGRRMLARARELGLKTMVGCMTESAVGISAIGQLLPMLDYVDMDGALLLAQDIARGVTIERGVVHLPAENGCGVTLL